MNEPPIQPRPTSADTALAHLDQVEQLLCELREAEHLRNTPAQFLAITFNGAGEPPVLLRRDEHGPPARSIAIVNPNPVRIYLGLSGAKTKYYGDSGDLTIQELDADHVKGCLHGYSTWKNLDDAKVTITVSQPILFNCHQL